MKLLLVVGPCEDADVDRCDVDEEGGCPVQLLRMISGMADSEAAMRSRRTGEMDGRDVDDGGSEDDDYGRNVGEDIHCCAWPGGTGGRVDEDGRAEDETV